MSEANARQVGGNHYKRDGKLTIEHWDLVELHGIGYLEGCATKYVSRWKQKNGMQDLDKAGHYIEKLRELVKAGKRNPRGAVPYNVLEAFSIGYGLTNTEQHVIDGLCRWQELADLDRVEYWYKVLLHEAKNYFRQQASMTSVLPDLEGTLADEKWGIPDTTGFLMNSQDQADTLRSTPAFSKGPFAGDGPGASTAR